MKPRIRSIKPEVLQDERLWDLALETGMPVLQAFVGLWCYADREGRFEWRPRALRPLLLPYWEGGDGSFGALLDALEKARFLVRYTVGGKTYGYVRNFQKHQRVNAREETSILPPPPVTDSCPTNPEASTESDHPARGEGNGRELEWKGEGGSRQHATRAPEVPKVPGLEIVAEPSAPLPAVPHDGPLKPSQWDQAPPVLQPLHRVMRFEYDPGWSPTKANQARGHELGLTDEEIWARWESVREKPYPRGFWDDQKQFNRELAWCAQDKTTKTFKTRAEREAFETPGRERRA